MEETKEISKRAAEKARKKAEKAAKKSEAKAELALRPKPEKAEKPKEDAPARITNPYAEGWLRKVRLEKPTPTVTSRFPPEPNGYLHVGHAKAIAVNFNFARTYGGNTILRADDTNPEKEEAVYFESIKEIVEWLGFKPYKITHSSDWFDKLYEHAEELIRRDKAYVCHCTKDEVYQQRGGKDHAARYGCSHRDRPVEESLAEFRRMKDGHYKAGEALLRMKQGLTDPAEGNPQMWDIAAYRVLEKNWHPLTKNKWKIYPTYDFAHCLCDAYEEITHSLCTTEFLTSRPSYDWLLEQLDLKIPKSESKGPTQREYGKLVLEGTILSKRRLKMLVDGATFEIPKPDGTTETKTVPPAVRGWDDPRLHTLIAIRRRGIPAKAVLSFIEQLGVTDANTVIQAVRFDSAVRKFLERAVPRVMMVLDPVKLVIEDFAESDTQDLKIPYDPKQPEGLSRLVPFTKTVYIERSDFREEDHPDFFRLAPGKTVGLLNTPFPIKATSFSTDSTGKVTEIRAVKAEGKPKAFIHWVTTEGTRVVARQYNSLFSVEEPNSLDWKQGGYFESLNPKSEIVWDAVIEPSFEQLLKDPPAISEGESDGVVRFQAVRTGYFAVDPELSDGKKVLNQIVSLKEDTGKGK